MSMTCLMVLLVVLGTCFLRKYVFDAYEGVRCRNYHRWVSLRWRIPRRNHLMGDWLFHLKAIFMSSFASAALVTYGEPTPGNYYMS